MGEQRRREYGRNGGMERKERKSQGPVVTCEGREGDGFWYAGTETGDAQVGV